MLLGGLACNGDGSAGGRLYLSFQILNLAASRSPMVSLSLKTGGWKIHVAVGRSTKHGRGEGVLGHMEGEGGLALHAAVTQDGRGAFAANAWLGRHDANSPAGRGREGSESTGLAQLRMRKRAERSRTTRGIRGCCRQARRGEGNGTAHIPGVSHGFAAILFGQA